METAAISTKESEQQIVEWLDSCNEAVAAEQADQSIPPSSPSQPKRTLKRKLSAMDAETPRAAKRQATATGLATPSASNNDEADISQAGRTQTPSLRSSASTTSRTSRSSSPSKQKKQSKRRREPEIQFSTPAVVTFLTRLPSKLWKESNIDTYPLLRTLLDALSVAQAGINTVAEPPHVLSNLRKILDGIEYCKERSANEDSWCEKVVYPAWQLAAELTCRDEDINVINVKSIDVYPNVLLPTNAQAAAVPSRRVDHTIGSNIADSTQTSNILQAVENNTITQSIEGVLRDQALFSHIEVKTRRSPDDARFQLSTWCTAGFQKQKNLWLQRHCGDTPDLLLAPIPLWLWEETRVQLWIAAMDPKEAKVHILEEKEFLISEDEPDTLLMVLSVMKAVTMWGKQCYLPWLRGLIGLQPEAG